MSVRIEKAQVEHLNEIEVLIRRFAHDELLLPRSYDNLLEKRVEFSVAILDGVDEEAPGEEKIVGCVALAREYDGLGEIRSLAVHPDFGGRGIGGLFIDACEKEAATLGFEKVFALTYIPDFFSKRQYDVVDKATLPQKIWNHCWKCSKFFDCKETAVVKVVG